MAIGLQHKHNQTTRNIGSDSFTLIYNAENQLVEVKKNSVSMATFVYDGDGRRVKSVIGSETILFVGGHYEIKNPGSGQTIIKYYFAGSSRIAMRKYTIPQSMSVEYLLGDHLGSTSITTDSTGAKVSEMRYKPWGEVRYSWTAGLSTTPAYKLNSYTFTGQYSYMDDPSTAGVTEGFGLLFYNARWMDPAIGRFVQADTIVPGGVQGLDRYAYVNNSPINYIDPSGHESVCGYSYSDPECESGGTSTGVTSGLTILDFSKLSNVKGGKTDISAADIYRYYLELYDQPDGWWWKAFPNFTIWDLLSIFTYNESGYHLEQAGVFAEAGVRLFVEWAEVKNKTTDVYGVLDWWARFSDSAELLIKNKAEPKLQKGHTPADYRAMAIVGGSFNNIPDGWKAGWAADRPFGWGNESVLNANAAEMYAQNLHAMFFYLTDKDPFYIPSGCAWLNWQENQNRASCSAVP